MGISVETPVPPMYFTESDSRFRARNRTFDTRADVNACVSVDSRGKNASTRGQALAVTRACDNSSPLVNQLGVNT